MAIQSPAGLDAALLLKLLIGPCDDGASDHAWRKCRRCTTLHLLENRDAFIVSVLRDAADMLGQT